MEYFYEIKSNEKLIKLSFWSYILLYTLRKMFSQNMPWYSKHYENLVIFAILGRFSSIFLSTVVEWTTLLVFQRIRTNMYTSLYFADKFFPKFAWRFQILQKFGHFFIIIFRNFSLIFLFLWLTRHIWSIVRHYLTW